jgi:hypothetical protein
MKLSKPYLHWASFLVSFWACSLLLTSCVQQESIGDTTIQEMDRQKSAADQIETQYARVKGSFTGHSGASDILLVLDVDREGAGGLVPKPNLVGNLVFTPSVLVDGSSQPMSITYPVVSGQYDGSGDLFFAVQQNGAQTTVHCKVTDESRLDCNWYSNRSLAFTLSRAFGQSLVSSGSAHFGGNYVGSNQDYRQISAFFRTFLTTQSGSIAVPQISIVGHFTFYPRASSDFTRNGATDPGFAKFPFTDGEYDPASSTLAIRMSGDNPIVVNCEIKTISELHCIWIGNHGEKSYEEFDLKKADAS